MFDFSRKTIISRGLYDQKTRCASSLSAEDIINSMQRHQRQSDSETLWLWVSVGGETWGVKKLSEWWNPVLPLSLFYTARFLYSWRSTSYHSCMKTLYNRQMRHENKLESSNSKRLSPARERLILGLFNNDASTTETV